MNLIEHLPLYADGQRRGRIRRIVGCRVELSTAPVNAKPSESTGFPLVPITVPEGWAVKHGAAIGHYVAVARNGWLTLEHQPAMVPEAAAAA
jgi:hypothetical protein